MDIFFSLGSVFLVFFFVGAWKGKPRWLTRGKFLLLPSVEISRFQVSWAASLVFLPSSRLSSLLSSLSSLVVSSRVGTYMQAVRDCYVAPGPARCVCTPHSLPECLRTPG